MERFGTETALYHKLQYNVRGQLWDVRVATGSDVNGSWNRGALQFFYDGTYGFGTSGPDNNGNVLKSKHYVPLDETSSTWAIHDQVYNYDALNRLSWVAEYFVSNSQSQTQQSLQSYTYDRWGNRTINPASWGTGINVKQFAVDPNTNRLGVPVGQTGVMTYDFAGNLMTDTYTGAGTRTYDAENRMLTAADSTGQTSRYTYDADGRRTRRQVAGSQEQWQIYGFEGELLAEYRASSPASSPEKEYGYRNGQLLITATGRFNVALAANGAVATASSAHTCCGFSTTGAINGNNRGPWANGEGWNDATENQVPDWIQVAFAGDKTIDEISVFSLHDNYTQENTPTETQTFSLYGLLAFDVQYWNGSSWVTIPGGNVTGNNKVWRKFTFSPITTSKIRVHINSVTDLWSRVVEIQAFGTSAGGDKVQWLVPDHLGTPRIIVDLTGERENVKRHDYLPFGEELFAGTGGRTTALGYAGDGVRQQFTSKERDVETGLDYFNARYYSSTQGRFSSPDPFGGSGFVSVPQSWNKYAYCLNRPFVFTDPSGMIWLTNDNTFFFWVDDAKYKKNRKDYEGYNQANGAVGKVQSCTDSPRCNGVNKGDWVQFNANGTISHVADPTMTIRAQYDEQLEDNRLYFQLGMTRAGEQNPLFGPPGRSSTIYYENGGGQTRHYNEKGAPWVDVDWGHHPELGPSHVHWWDPNKDPRSEGARGDPEPAPPGWYMWDNGEAIPQPQGSVPFYPVPFGPMPGRPMMPLRPMVPLRPILVP